MVLLRLPLKQSLEDCKKILENEKSGYIIIKQVNADVFAVYKKSKLEDLNDHEKRYGFPVWKEYTPE